VRNKKEGEGREHGRKERKAQGGPEGFGDKDFLVPVQLEGKELSKKNPFAQ
jgi:hypothetical protein